MKNRKTYASFLFFILLMLMVTIFSAKLYKTFNKNLLLFDAIKALDDLEHRGQLKVITLGDAAIMNHHDFTISYDFKTNLKNIQHEQGALEAIKSWRNLNLFYDVIKNNATSLKNALEKNALSIKKQVIENVSLDHSKNSSSMSFTIEEGYKNWENILDMLINHGDFKVESLDLFKLYDEIISSFSKNNRQHALEISIDDPEAPFVFSQLIYENLITTFSKDSLMTMVFYLEDKVLTAISFEGHFNYKRFEATEKITWTINFN